MSLAKLFYLKETFRESVRRWRQACFRKRSHARREQRFMLEALEPRLLLSTFYNLEVVAETGPAIADVPGQTVTSIFEASINNQGQISVNAAFESGQGAVLVDADPAINNDLTLAGPPPSNALVRFPQINDSGQAVFNTRSFTSFFGLSSSHTSIMISDVNTQNFRTLDSSQTFNSLGPLYILPTIANNGGVAYIDASSHSLTGEFFGSLSGRGQRPMASDSALVVVDGTSGLSAQVKVFGSSIFGNGTLASTADRGGGLEMSEIGFSAGISDDGQVIAFAGRQSGESDPAVFLSYRDPRFGGWTTPVKIAGKRLIPGTTSADTNNEVPELGYQADGVTAIYMKDIDLTSRVAVIHEELGPAGIEGDSVVVSFIGTPSSSSVPNPAEALLGPARPLLFTGEKGLWTQRIDFEKDLTGTTSKINIHPTSPIPVVEIGNTITASGTTFTVGAIAVYDQLSRAATTIDPLALTNLPRIERYGDHQLAFVVTDQNNPGTQLVIRATHLDSDEDGLLDHWETKGIDMNGDGEKDLDLPGMGADPFKRDLFLEIDWLEPRLSGGLLDAGWKNELPPGVIAMLQKMFADAPELYANDPDLSKHIKAGITLHVDAGIRTDFLGSTFSIGMPTSALQGGESIAGLKGKRPDVVFFGKPGDFKVSDVEAQEFGALKAEFFFKNKGAITADRGARELAFHYLILTDFYDFARLNSGAPITGTIQNTERAESNTVVATVPFAVNPAGTVLMVLDSSGKKHFRTVIGLDFTDPTNQRLLLTDPWDTSFAPNSTDRFVLMSGSSGRAEVGFFGDGNSVPGNDSVITLGSLGGVTVKDSSGAIVPGVENGVLGNFFFMGRTIAHELGHNLGLRHGGTNPFPSNPDPGYAGPDYRSLMNYTYQFAQGIIPPFTTLVDSYSYVSDSIFDDWGNLTLAFQATFDRLGIANPRSTAAGVDPSQIAADVPSLGFKEVIEKFGPFDLLGPTVHIDQPIANMDVTIGSNLVVSANASDDSGVKEVLVLFDRDGNGNVDLQSERKHAVLGVDGNYSVSFIGIEGSLGQRFIEVFAVDFLGNVSSALVPVTIREESLSQPPAITLGLADDTGVSGIDRTTINPTITGFVTDSSGVTSFRAGFDATPVGSFLDVLSARQSNGSFTFTPAQLALLNGGPLSDGVHALHLQATDGLGHTSPVFDFSFTLDTIPPVVLTADLLAAMDTAPVGDQQTTFSLVTLVGQTEPNAVISLVLTGATTTADGVGIFRLTNVRLALGVNEFTVRATDAAGNSRDITRTIIRGIPSETQTPRIVMVFADGTGAFLPTDPPIGVPDEVTTDPNLLERAPSVQFLFRVLLDGRSSFVQDAYSRAIQLDGSFKFTRALLEEINGGPIGDGLHRLHLEAATLDDFGIPTSNFYTLQDIVFAVDIIPEPAEWITNNPTITGRVTDDSGLFSVRAGLDGTIAANFVDISGDLQPDGSFTLSPARLEQINGGPLTDGRHTLHLQALDVQGNVSPVQDLSLALDSTATAPTVDLLPASDGGTSSGDNVTSSGIPLVFNVTVPESNAQVRYTVTGPSTIGPMTLTPLGSATTVPITLTGLAAGSYTLSIQFMDVAGNISPATVLPFVIVDLPKLTVQLAHDTGGFIDARTQLPVGGSSDGITFDPSVTGAVSAPSGIVSLRAGFDATAIGEFADLLSDLQPAGTFILSQARLAQLNGGSLVDGAHMLHFRIVDGNGMVTTRDLAFVLDTTRPNPPTGLDLVALSDTGSSDNDNITGDNTPRISFLLPETTGNLLAFSNGELFVESGHKDISSIAFEPSFPQPDGVYAITARFEDVAGNISAFSEPLVITIDTGGVALTFDLAPSSDTGAIGDQQTSAPVVTLIGRTSPFASVALLTTGATTTADSTGAFTFSDVPVTLGLNLLEVGAEDEAGNIRQVSKTIERVELEPGDPPFLTARLLNDSSILLDTGEVFPVGADSDGVTSDPTVVGRVFTAGTIASFLAGFTDTPTFNILSDLHPNGKFSLSKARLEEINGAPLLDGAYLLRLKVVAEDSTESVATVQFVLDATAPSLPILDMDDTSDSGASHTDNVTNVTMPVFNVRLPGVGNEAWRFLLSANGELIDNDLFEVQLAPEGNDLTGQIAFLVPIPDGTYQMRSTLDDAAGNMSVPSSLLTITIDTTVALSFDLDSLSDTSTVGDQTTTFSPVTLTGHTDPGAGVTLLATGATTTSDDAGRFSFAGVPLALGDNLLTVQAVDKAGNARELTRTFTRISGFATNQAPVLADIGPQVATESQTLSFTVNAVDPDGDALVFSADGLPPSATFDPTTRLFSWTPTEAQGLETFGGVTFSVNDGRGLSDSETINISVAEANQAPVLAAIGNKTVSEGALLQFTISATDGDLPADTLIYSATNLPVGATFNPVTRTFSWTPTEAEGPAVFFGVILSVSDGVATTSETIKITVGEVNQAPLFSPIGNEFVIKGSTLTFVVGATDLDIPANPLIYGATGLPVGATFDSATHAFSWTPSAAQGPGVFEGIVFSVSDGVATTNETMSITVGELSPSPLVGTIGNQIVNEGEQLTFTVNAADASPSESTLSFSASNLPTGATFDPTTRIFRWTPTELQGQGLFDGLIFSVNYGQGGTEFETLSITVNEVNAAPVFTSVPVTTATRGQLYTYDVNAADADLPTQTLLFSLLTAPDGMTINASTGVINWTPTSTQVGNQIVTVGVTDGVIGTPVAQTFTLTTEAVTQVFTLDVDGNGQTDALTDGILIIRYLFGFTDTALTSGAVDPLGSRTVPRDIVAYLDQARSTMLDPDGNGQADALTDGIAIVRYLFGFTGDALINGVVDPAGTRNTAAAVEAFLSGFLPVSSPSVQQQSIVASAPVAPSIMTATTPSSNSTAAVLPVVDLTAESTSSTTRETAPLESYSLAYVQQSWVVDYVATTDDVTANDEELLIQLV